jgi:hypothetical protein
VKKVLTIRASDGQPLLILSAEGGEAFDVFMLEKIVNSLFDGVASALVDAGFDVSEEVEQ